MAAVAVGEWASGEEAPGPSFGVTSLRDFAVSRDPSLNLLIRSQRERLGGQPGAFAG